MVSLKKLGKSPVSYVSYQSLHFDSQKLLNIYKADEKANVLTKKEKTQKSRNA